MADRDRCLSMESANLSPDAYPSHKPRTPEHQSMNNRANFESIESTVSVV